jgi:hypothetical protein
VSLHFYEDFMTLDVLLVSEETINLIYFLDKGLKVT